MVRDKNMNIIFILNILKLKLYLVSAQSCPQGYTGDKCELGI